MNYEPWIKEKGEHKLVYAVVGYNDALEKYVDPTKRVKQICRSSLILMNSNGIHFILYMKMY